MKGFKYLWCLTFFGLMLITLSCKDTLCPEYIDYIPPRLLYLNAMGEDVLDPLHEDFITISSIMSEGGENIPFDIIPPDTINSAGSFWSIEVNDLPFKNDCEGQNTIACQICIDTPCNLYLSYDSIEKMDTLQLLFSTTFYDKDGDCEFVSYPLTQAINNKESMEISNFGYIFIQK